MELKKVDKNIFDLWLGKGWENWSRVEVSSNNVNVVSGLPLSKNVLESLKARLCKYAR